MINTDFFLIFTNIEDTDMIKEIPIQGFDAKLNNAGNNYPQSTNQNAMKLFSNFLFVSSRNSGKTHSCVKLIKNGYENCKLVDNDGIVHPLRTFLISPTSEQKIFENLKSLDENDIYQEYTDEIFQNIIDEIERTNEEINQYKLYKDTYELIKRTNTNNILKLISENPEIIEILQQYNFQNPDEIDIKYKEKPANFVILDDLMSSSAFSRKTQNLLTYYLIRNRHHFISFFILVQHLRAVPPSIINNCNVYFIGKFASHKYILDQLYEMVSNVLTEEQFSDLYSHSIKEKYGALIIDNSGDTKRFYKSLDKELIIE